MTNDKSQLTDGKRDSPVISTADAIPVVLQADVEGRLQRVLEDVTANLRALRQSIDDATESLDTELFRRRRRMARQVIVVEELYSDSPNLAVRRVYREDAEIERVSARSALADE